MVFIYTVMPLLYVDIFYSFSFSGPSSKSKSEKSLEKNKQKVSPPFIDYFSYNSTIINHQLYGYFPNLLWTQFNQLINSDA